MPTASGREERSARGAAVHALLEWSQAHGWAEPSEELARRHAAAAGLGPGDRSASSPNGDDDLLAGLLAPVRGWLQSGLRERIEAAGTKTRAETPILLGVGGAVLRGSIDLLVEREGEPPLVVDYKTDRLDGSAPEERAAGYETQRSIYALAVAEALQVDEVELAYVFLERPEQPVLTRLGPTEMEAGRNHLREAIARISRGEFPAAAKDDRTWSLCRGCPALGRLCSGPESE